MLILSGQMLSNIFYHSPNVAQILSNTARCPKGKMFGLQTMFDRVWSQNISRLDKAFLIIIQYSSYLRLFTYRMRWP